MKLAAHAEITDGARVYGKTSVIQEFVSEDYYRQLRKQWYSKEELDRLVQSEPKTEDGLDDNAQLYGMESLCSDHLKVLKDLPNCMNLADDYIAAVYSEDDYGDPTMDSSLG